ncbi:hypothetical protein KCP76_06140 [Salmonella enterica subsp. enterica serovar Weltevreden]|nr:hypothetical protein KCP76_06140 [Salmonella enterica subsp. enterica serovar Weltevreden]
MVRFKAGVAADAGVRRALALKRELAGGVKRKRGRHHAAPTDLQQNDGHPAAARGDQQHREDQAENRA